MAEEKKFQVFDQEGNFVNAYEDEDKAKSLVSKHVGWSYKSSTPSNAAGSTDGNGDEPESYNDLTVAELKAELEARKIEAPLGSKKADLVKILEDNDASGEKEAPTE